MSISDEQLLKWDLLGWVPAPLETEENLIKRIELTKKLTKDPGLVFDGPFEKITQVDIEWASSKLYQLFLLRPTCLPCVCSDKKMSLLHGAVTWEVEEKEHRLPLIQLRKAFKKKKKWKLYRLDEVFAHEAAHAVRIGFNEPKYEEMFAYMTSHRLFRRFLGPLFTSRWQAILLSFSFCSLFVFNLLDLFFYNSFFSLGYLSSVFLVSFNVSCLFFSLFYRRRKWSKSFSKLKKKLGCSHLAMGLLFRMKDDEIDLLAKIPLKKIDMFFLKKKDSSLRERLLFLLFSQNKD